MQRRIWFVIWTIGSEYAVTGRDRISSRMQMSIVLKPGSRCHGTKCGGIEASNESHTTCIHSQKSRQNMCPRRQRRSRHAQDRSEAVSRSFAARAAAASAWVVLSSLAAQLADPPAPRCRRRLGSAAARSVASRSRSGRDRGEAASRSLPGDSRCRASTTSLEPIFPLAPSD